MGEIWRDIAGYEGLYQVSNYGRVKSCQRKEHGASWGTRTRKERIRKTRINREGYEQLQLWKDGKQHTFTVHVLVANAFLDRCCDGLEVNHIDGNKANNRVDNLEWVTHSENVTHSFKKLGRVGNTNRRKLTETQVREIRAAKGADSEIAKNYPVTRGAIYLIRHRKTYKNVV